MSLPDWPCVVCVTCNDRTDEINKAGEELDALVSNRMLVRDVFDSLPSVDLRICGDSSVVSFVYEHRDHELVVE